MGSSSRQTRDLLGACQPTGVLLSSAREMELQLCSAFPHLQTFRPFFAVPVTELLHVSVSLLPVS
jgi:hypothetical protein